MSSTHAYLMESSIEAERLEAKTRDAESDQQLDLVGLARGMRVLDVGAGTGAVARVMARKVGQQGRVVALDVSPERLAFGAEIARRNKLDNLQFIASDLDHPALRPGSFDLVWCRYVFQYLAKPASALQRMIELTRPGGTVAVADIDGYGIFHHPCPDELREGLAKLERALKGRFDPFAGRKLFHHFHQAGLERIRVHLLPHHLYAGSAPTEEIHNWEIKFWTLRPAGSLAFGGENSYDSFVRNFLDFLASPSTFTYSVLLLVHGVRPPRVE